MKTCGRVNTLLKELWVTDTSIETFVSLFLRNIVIRIPLQNIQRAWKIPLISTENAIDVSRCIDLSRSFANTWKQSVPIMTATHRLSGCVISTNLEHEIYLKPSLRATAVSNSILYWCSVVPVWSFQKILTHLKPVLQYFMIAVPGLYQWIVQYSAH